MRDVLWITLGAACGANLRFLVNRAAIHFFSASLPYGTLIVNVTGSFLIGFFLVWSGERVLVDPRWRALIAIGFCGSYTTFSSYAYETFSLWQQGHYSLFLANFFVNNFLAFAGVVGGALTARLI